MAIFTVGIAFTKNVFVLHGPKLHSRREEVVPSPGAWPFGSASRDR